MSKDSDKRFICAYQIDNDGSIKELKDYTLKKKADNTCFQWFHLDFKSIQAQNWLNKFSGLNQTHLEALLKEETRPRIHAFDTGYLFTFRSINHNQENQPEDMVSLRLWCEPHRIISIQNRPVTAFTDIIKDFKKGNPPTNTSEFLHSLTRLITNYIFEVAADIDTELDDMETLNPNEPLTKSDQLKLSEYRRRIIGLRRFIVPQRVIFNEINSARISWLSETDRLRIRETGDLNQRILEDLDMLREHSIVIMDEIKYALSEKLNRSMFQLAIVATIFLPLGLITGLLGINVLGIPGTDYPFAFYIVCGILAISIILELVLLKWFKILD